MFLRAVSVIMLAAHIVASPTIASAGDVLPGPYSGEVERVVDGDTIAVRVRVWLDQDIRVLVRVRGVDAPELNGRCESEKDRAVAAGAALSRMVGTATVLLSNIEGDKYYGRVLADVGTRDGTDVGHALLNAGLARPYQGGRRGGWCEVGATEGGTQAQLADAAEAR